MCVLFSVSASDNNLLCQQSTHHHCFASACMRMCVCANNATLLTQHTIHHTAHTNTMAARAHQQHAVRMALFRNNTQHCLASNVLHPRMCACPKSSSCSQHSLPPLMIECCSRHPLKKNNPHRSHGGIASCMRKLGVIKDSRHLPILRQTAPTLYQRSQQINTHAYMCLAVTPPAACNLLQHHRLLAQHQQSMQSFACSRSQYFIDPHVTAGCVLPPKATTATPTTHS